MCVSKCVNYKFCQYTSTGFWEFLCMAFCVSGELLNHKKAEQMNLWAHLIKNKFIHVHLIEGVVLSGAGARDGSESRCEPPSESEAPPRRLEVPKERYGRNLSMNHGANINIVHYPIREIKHVNPSFNCWMFCCLNSAWLRAVPRQMELQCASKSSNSHRTGGRTLHFKSSGAGILELLLLHFFGIWLITLCPPSSHQHTHFLLRPRLQPWGLIKHFFFCLEEVLSSMFFTAAAYNAV